jgi:hypothetical protein
MSEFFSLHLGLGFSGLNFRVVSLVLRVRVRVFMFAFYSCESSFRGKVIVFRFAI